MIRAAVFVFIALIGQIGCEYFNPNYHYDEKPTARYLNDIYPRPDSGSYVVHPHPRNSVHSGPPVNIQCPAATPRHIHVKAGFTGKPHINVIAPPNPTPVTVQCPHAPGNHILVQGAPNPQPIITFDHNTRHDSIQSYYGRLYSKFFYRPYSHNMLYNKRS